MWRNLLSSLFFHPIKFEKCLNLKTYDRVISFQIQNLSEFMDKASIVERSLQRSISFYNAWKSRVPPQETDWSENQDQWKKNKSTEDTKTKVLHERIFPSSQDRWCEKLGKVIVMSVELGHVYVSNVIKRDILLENVALVKEILLPLWAIKGRWLLHMCIHSLLKKLMPRKSD